MAGTLKARVLVLCVCSGILLPGGVVDPQQGLLATLLSDATVGAVLTTYSILVTNATRLDALSEAIARGETLGAALSRARTRDSASDRILLIGDPRTRAVSPTVHRPIAGSSKVSSSPQRRRRFRADDIIANGAFVFAMLGWPIGTGGGADWAQAEKALATLSERDTVLLKDWLATADPLAHVLRQPCAHCDAMADVFRATFSRACYPDRRVVICPRCGVTEDTSWQLRMLLSIAGRSIGLNVLQNNGEWRGLVHIGAPGQVEIITFEWPALPDGSPARQMNLPVTLPIGPLRISVVFARPDAFGIVGRFWRADDLEPRFKQIGSL